VHRARVFIGFVAMSLFVGSVPLRAAVTLLVHEPIGFEGEFAGAGHAAVYLSNLCSDDLVTVRICRAGEEGVVLSTYPGFVADAAPYWIAVPLSAYLFGSTTSDDVPIYGSRAVLNAARTAFGQRKRFLLDRGFDIAGKPIGSWPLLIGNAFQRIIYGLTLETTPEQDVRLLAALHDVQKRRVFDLSYNNCADFSRFVINSYFPGAVGRDAFNDFSFTTPKALARALTAYGTAHRDLGFAMTRYAQIGGPLPRSRPNLLMAEKFVSSRKYFGLMLALNAAAPAALTVLTAATGHFDLDDAFERHQAPSEWDGLIDDPTWKRHRREVARAEVEAIDRGLFPDRGALRRFAESLQAVSTPDVGADGALQLRVATESGRRVVSLARNRIEQSPSDPQLAYRLVLSLIARQANEPGLPRLTRQSVDADWQLLTRLRRRPEVWTTPPPQLTCPVDARCEVPKRPSLWKRILLKISR
jgi:hypothetical protein